MREPAQGDLLLLLPGTINASQIRGETCFNVLLLGRRLSRAFGYS